MPMNEATGSFHTPLEHFGPPFQKHSSDLSELVLLTSPLYRKQQARRMERDGATLSCHANFQPFPRIKYLGGEAGGAAGAWKVMNINRCCKQMLECSRHTYLIILGTENSSWMVQEQCRSFPSEGLCPRVQHVHRPGTASPRAVRWVHPAPVPGNQRGTGRRLGEGL